MTGERRGSWLWLYQIRVRGQLGQTIRRAGAGSGLMQAMRQVDGSIGVAVLGTVRSSGYCGRVRTGHLPAALVGATRDSVAAGIPVARQLYDSGLAQVVRAAFVHGMEFTLIVSVAVGAVIAALFLPRRRAAKEGSESPQVAR